MSEVSEYGNLAWYVFVIAAYLTVFLALAAYTIFAWRSRDSALGSLREEGYLEEALPVRQESFEKTSEAT